MHVSTAVTRIGLLLAALLAACAAPPTDTLRVSGHRLFIPVTVNGIETEALLDSGAEMTLIDAQFAERLGLEYAGEDMAKGTGGSQPIRFAENVAIEAPGFATDDLTVAVLDLRDISARLVGEPVRVVMGREIFDSGRYLVDITGRRFERLPRSSAPAGTALTLTEERGIRQLPVRIDDLPPTRADFDLGNGNEVLLGRDYAVASGLLEAHPVIGTKAGGGIGGELQRELVVVDRLGIASVNFDDVTVAIDPTPTASSGPHGVLRRMPGPRTNNDNQQEFRGIHHEKSDHHAARGRLAIAARRTRASRGRAAAGAACRVLSLHFQRGQGHGRSAEGHHPMERFHGRERR